MSLRFALPAHAVSDAPAVAELCDMLVAHGGGKEITVSIAGSYNQLAAMVRSGEAAFAWVPPLVFTGLERRNEAVALVSLRLDPNQVYMSALVVRSDSPIQNIGQLRGARAGWVDRWSASGYVVPRIALASEKTDPRGLFSSETFFHTHDAVLSALAAGEIDVGACFARQSPKGQEGPWTKLGVGVRVLGSWGPIPSDVVAASGALDPTAATNLRRALLSVGRDGRGRVLVRRVFNVDELQPWVSETYDVMRRAMTDAAKRGLLD
jgi:phosphate/phosphite/phosphonate ABC transporter binding protein